MQRLSYARGPLGRDLDPRPVLPGRSVPDVLLVAALQLGHPISLFVLMKANDAPSGPGHERRFGGTRPIDSLGADRQYRA